jgi:hypothetical protein
MRSVWREAGSTASNGLVKLLETLDKDASGIENSPRVALFSGAYKDERKSVAVGHIALQPRPILLNRPPYGKPIIPIVRSPNPFAAGRLALFR